MTEPRDEYLALRFAVPPLLVWMLSLLIFESVAFDLAAVAAQLSDVLKSGAVAAPDADRGAVVKAYVVLREGASGDDALVKALQDHVKRVTAPYKYPRQIEFVTELPKTVSGKIRRVELRERARSGQ